MLWPETQLKEVLDQVEVKGSVTLALGSPREAHLCRQALYRLMDRKVLPRVIISIKDNILNVSKPQLPSITLIRKDNAA